MFLCKFTHEIFMSNNFKTIRIWERAYRAARIAAATYDMSITRFVSEAIEAYAKKLGKK